MRSAAGPDPPDMSHDHEWRPVEHSYPLLEDGAAIFHEKCGWEKVLDAEPGYDGGYVPTETIPCESERRKRVPASSIVDRYKVEVLDVQADDDYRIATAIAEVESAYRDNPERIRVVDADPEEPRAVAENGRWRIIYEESNDE